MNMNLLSFIAVVFISLSEIVSANPTDVCKIGIITADVVDESTQLPSKINVEQLRAYLVKNATITKDIFGIDQFRGKVCILANNVSRIIDGNSCEKILMALPNYTEKNTSVRSLKIVYMEIPVEFLRRSYEPK